ncbi:MAG: 4-alpha-glucanotransferase [Desulfobaccales bacterium]
MADPAAAAEIAFLGRLCGIAPEYRDNFGGRRLAPLSTIQALLSAMGVSWEEPERRRQELSRRRLGPWGRFLEPVQVLAPSSPGRLNFFLWAPSVNLPSSLRIEATVQGEGDSGQGLDWQEEFASPATAASRAVPGGVRHRLELRLPRELPLGYYELQLRVEADGRAESGRSRLLVAPDHVYFPDCLAGGRRLWGFNLPLYALRSAGNWGIGDFRDLTALLDWAATLGAAFVGVNPLHAPSPLPAADPSPYAPTSRLFHNFLYLDLEQVPEMEFCPEARELLANREFQANLARLRQGPQVPYSQVFRLKFRVLELLFQAFWERHGPPEAPGSRRGEEFAAFLRQGGAILQRFGEFGALADHFQQGDWHCWPEEYRHPGNPVVAAWARERPRQIRLHQYAQWLAAGQLQEVISAAAHRQGLPFTLYQDLALGAAAGSFDTWAHPGLFARGAAIGAPPDAFNPKGQNWGISPIIPQALRESGYQLFIEALRANAPASGMLRLDHVMGLFRLLWIPSGEVAGQGAYVHYPARELLAILALESMRRRTLIIGEDLGTMTARVRRELKRLGVFSYRVFYFERDAAGRFLAPQSYPAQAIAAVTTHDLPTLTGFWQGRDLAFKRQANLYPEAGLAEAEAAARQRDRLELIKALKGRGLLAEEAKNPDPQVEPRAAGPAEAEVREGVLEYLAQSSAALLEVRLEEVFGWPEQQNFPGTDMKHPNWRGRLPWSLEEMARDQAPTRLAARLNKYRKR